MKKKIIILCLFLNNLSLSIFSMSTELHTAVKNKNLPELKRIIEIDHTNINTQDEAGKTPLHLAAETGQADIVFYLIKEKALLEILDRDGRTPYFLAVMNQMWGPAYLLKWNVAKKDIKDHNGKHPIEYTFKKLE